MSATSPKKPKGIFENGSVWLSADFHLHTKADKEFSYTGEENRFVTVYIEGLKKANIQVGVIANHNKFAQGEYKALRRAAKREDIFLLPGIELSVKDGSSGVHTIVVFDYDWINNQDNTNYIQSFIDSTFAGQSRNFENENARSNHDIIGTLRELEKFKRDFFLIFAHVEANNGLWGSLDGGRLQDLGCNTEFKRRCAAFQKVRTQAKRNKVKMWLGDWYPAEVDGSDCKSIDNIGQGQSCFLKIGAFTFEAVQYALFDYEHRVSKKKKSYSHSYVRSISFEGGVLDDKTVSFSPELNSLIGIRGSGKSSILEIVRYVLDIPFGDKTSDREYKENLVRHVLGSGGKAVIQVVDRHGQQYEIRRILNEMPELFIDEILQPGVSIRETVVHKPIYFGQKDLSTSGEGFEKDLVEKLVGVKLNDVRRRIKDQKIRVQEAVDKLQKLAVAEERKKEWEQKKMDAEFRLKVFKDHGIEEKLQRQADFDTDAQKLRAIISVARDFSAETEEFLSRFEDDLKNAIVYKSKWNKPFFKNFFTIYKRFIAILDTIKSAYTESKTVMAELQRKVDEFNNLKKGLREEFAEIERKLSEKLKAIGVQSVRPDEFLSLRKQVDQATQRLEVLNKKQLQRIKLKDDLLKQLNELNELWHEEYRTIEIELKKVNANNSSLTIKAGFKEDREALAAYLKDMFRGSRLRDPKYRELSEQYSDCREIYRAMKTVKALIGDKGDTFEQYFIDNIRTLLTWQTPNRFAIFYRGKELRHHSLGQRASALMLFVLSQRDNDVIIIDQPEDDLDNQTIYEDVIKLIREIKTKTQFIFATHNANFPVLGDAEQMHACNYADDIIYIQAGSIDKPELQKGVVNIMEGGQEAFNQRKRIYQIWNPKNS